MKDEKKFSLRGAEKIQREEEHLNQERAWQAEGKRKKIIMTTVIFIDAQLYSNIIPRLYLDCIFKC